MAVPGKREVGVSLSPLSAPISPLSCQGFLFLHVTVGHRADLSLPASHPDLPPPQILEGQCHPCWGPCYFGKTTERLGLGLPICKTGMSQRIEPLSGQEGFMCLSEYRLNKGLSIHAVGSRKMVTFSAEV